MKEGSKSKALALVDNNAKEFEFHNSVQELKNLSSQLYHAADYCEKTFVNAPHKTLGFCIVETTKEYISRAVVTIVDHLGSISTNLERCISNTNSVPETTQHRIHTLNQRIMTCQQYSLKPRFHWGAEFSRFHCRYIALPKPLTHSAVKNAVSRDSEAKSEKDNPFVTEEPLFLYTYNCKPCLVHRGLLPPAKNKFEDNKNLLLPVRDGVPRTVHSAFRFQEDQKLKRSTRNWKVLMQNKDINSLIRRGKRILS
ncbi:hypothetical protein BUALT_Bualt09G0021600 [Buddleja alternifolia]|uniref:Protein ABIL5 n=1 Tax=Buddleja alternifolia TaxID=168488 RepID=A0AAV6X0F6_9LAMI|nr:hypothetical protein BUALT_Bualt09G0021600 [Buddleja alternifolia]